MVNKRFQKLNMKATSNSLFINSSKIKLYRLDKFITSILNLKIILIHGSNIRDIHIKINPINSSLHNSNTLNINYKINLIINNSLI